MRTHAYIPWISTWDAHELFFATDLALCCALHCMLRTASMHKYAKLRVSCGSLALPTAGHSLTTTMQLEHQKKVTKKTKLHIENVCFVPVKRAASQNAPNNEGGVTARHVRAASDFTAEVRQK